MKTATDFFAEMVAAAINGQQTSLEHLQTQERLFDEYMLASFKAGILHSIEKIEEIGDDWKTRGVSEKYAATEYLSSRLNKSLNTIQQIPSNL